MGSTTDRIKGLANEAIGNTKQGIGEVTGDAKLQGEGPVAGVQGPHGGVGDDGIGCAAVYLQHALEVGLDFRQDVGLVRFAGLAR